MKVLTNIFVSNHQVFEIIIYVMFVLFLQTTDKNKQLKSWCVLLHLVSKQVSVFIIFFWKQDWSIKSVAPAYCLCQLLAKFLQDLQDSNYNYVFLVILQT